MALTILALASILAMDYPESKRLDLKETIHGVEVPDPYRWLEEDSKETQDWVQRQSKFATDYLKTLPYRAQISKKLQSRINYERFTVPFKEGGRYFYTRNDGLQNQNVLYVATSLNAKPRVLLDPNRLSKDGTVALGGTSVSDDGKLLAYSTSASGSDWQEWKVRDVATGKDRKDHLKWVKFSDVSWTKDSKGFFYSRYDAPKAGAALQEQNYYQKLYYHRLGTPQASDMLIYQRKDQKEWGFDGSVTEDGKYLVISIWQGSNPENRVYVADISKGMKIKPIVMFGNPDAEYSVLGNDGSKFFVKTNKGAPNGKIIAVDTVRKIAPRVVIPEAKETLEGASMVGGKIVTTYLKDAHSQVKVFGKDGKFVREVKLPGLGSVGGFGGRMKETETFYNYTSYTTPSTIYRYDLSSGKSTVFKKPKVNFDPAKYETKQVFFPSKDGTRIPIFLTYRKGIKMDGSNPTLMYGYGGFVSNETPYFSVINLSWIDMGGIYAHVVLRGGGEYGEEWHKAGMLHNKQNVFDDFIGAGEYLIAKKYTSTPKLAISGASNGGLLVGACMTQRPDLFGACLPAVGVMDMLRFQRFTIGWAWQGEYGFVDKVDDFKYLLGYSPYHNIKEGTAYPPTLITTADHDDRVVPAHSFKFVAEMQHAQSGDNPIIIRIETKAGHGGGKPITKVIEEVTDTYAFLIKHLGFTPIL